MNTITPIKKSDERINWLFSPWMDTLLLVAIIALAIYLRSFGIAHGRTYHPDERHMIMVTEKLKENGMNPGSFAYGSFSFYALWYTSRFAAFIWNLSNRFGGNLGWPDPTGYDGLIQVGRVLCMFFGITALPLLYGLGLKLYRSSAAGLLAAMLLSVNVFHIQLSRFFTSDITLTTLSLASIFSLVTVFQTGSLFAYFSLGIFLGLATATKISSVFLATPLALTVVILLVRTMGWKKSLFMVTLATLSCLCVFLVAIFSYRWLAQSFPIPFMGRKISGMPLLILVSGPLVLICSIPLRALTPHLSRPLVALAIGAITFVIAEPFAVLDYATFVRHTQEQTNMVQGLWRPPYTIQYENTVPYFYHLKQMVWYTMGLPVFLLVLVGFFCAGVRVIKNVIETFITQKSSLHPMVAEAIPLVFIVVFFIATAGFQVKFPRYLMPIYPILFLFAGSLARYSNRNEEKKA
jgi:4-amino-4-deoxy-L-arabinose transferase-like glycosyltransferase